MRIALALISTAALTAAEPAYDLHEWGVFTTNPGNPFVQQDYKEEWESFPDFFTKVSPLEVRYPLCGSQDPAVPKPGVVVRKPVVFIHADGDLSLNLAFTLHGGKPLVWWPAALATGETVRFNVQVFASGIQRGPSIEFRGPPVPAGHWIEHLRAVGANQLLPITDRGEERRETVPALGDSFLYYDGLLPALPQPTLSPEGSDKHEYWTLTNTATYTWNDVLLIWKDGDAVRVSPWQDTIAPGGQATLPLWPLETAIAANGPLAGQVQQRLVKAGLSEAEAASLVGCWKEGLFAHEGLTVIYRLPQAIYEQLIPLTATPAPRHAVRVGLVVQQHLEPSLTTDVQALIGRLCTAAEGDRPALMARLKAYGGAAFPVLRARVAANDPESVVCRRLLAELDLAAP